MAESGFKISDLETIPLKLREDGTIEKIALENTYFLGYSHTVHGIKYTTQNYKIPLEALRKDIQSKVMEVVTNTITDPTLFGFINNFGGLDNIYSINVFGSDIINVTTTRDLNDSTIANLSISMNDPISSDKSIIIEKNSGRYDLKVKAPQSSNKTVIISQTSSGSYDFKIPQPKSSDNTVKISHLSDGSYDLTVDSNSLDIADKTKIEAADSSIKVSNKNGIWLISATAGDGFTYLADEEHIFAPSQRLDNLEKKHIFVADNIDSEAKNLSLGFYSYISDVENSKLDTHGITNTKLYVNTTKIQNDYITVGAEDTDGPVMWVGIDKRSPKFFKNRLYCINISSLPMAVFGQEIRDKWSEDYKRIIVLSIDWFIHL